MSNQVIEETEHFQLVHDASATWEYAYYIFNKKRGTIEVKGPSYATMLYYLVEAERGLDTAEQLLEDYRNPEGISLVEKGNASLN